MAQKWYYAVKKGRDIGIFTSWIECKKSINGFSGADYKKFPTEKEALNWLNNADQILQKSLEENITEKIDESEYDIIAYTDGSYKENKYTFTYGAVLIFAHEILELKEKFNNSFWLKSRNIAGEIMGVVKVVQVAIEYGFKSLLIYHDYSGLANWINGQWKAKKNETIAFKEFIIEKMKEIKIKFVKVKSHSANKYNDLADKLANDAYNLEEHSAVLLDSNFVYLDMELLPEYINNILKDKFNLAEYEVIEESPKIKRFAINADNKKTILSFNYKSTGQVTISYAQDSIGYIIKQELENNYSIKDRLPAFYTSINLKKTEINSFISNIKELESKEIKVLNKNNVNNYVLESYDLCDEFSKVSCLIYNTGKIVFQGKASFLMSKLTSILSQIKSIDTKQFFEFIGKLYNSENSLNNIETELKNLAPKSFNHLPKEIKNMLISSLISSKTKISKPYYDDVCFHSLKALEAQMNVKLNLYSQMPKNKKGFMFHKIFSGSQDFNGIFKMNSVHKQSINDRQIVDALEQTYTFFKKERHTIFHANMILVQTRFLMNLAEARDVIYECIKLIEYFY